MLRVIERYGMLWTRLWFGGFNLISGLNYWVPIFPFPKIADPLGASYFAASVQLGLFQMAKAIELVAGLSLISGIGVPLALILLFPVTLNVFVLNAFFADLAHIRASGTRNFLFHLTLLAYYSGYYLPLLKVRARPAPIWRAARRLKQFL